MASPYTVNRIVYYELSNQVYQSTRFINSLFMKT